MRKKEERTVEVIYCDFCKEEAREVERCCICKREGCLKDKGYTHFAFSFENLYRGDVGRGGIRYYICHDCAKKKPACTVERLFYGMMGGESLAIEKDPIS